jgi:uncharacterized protein involved in exopolysaccharide biosynthesis
MGAPPLPEPHSRLAFLDILAVVLKRWRTTLLAPLITTLAVGVGLTFVPNTYTATTSVVPAPPQHGSLSSALSGLASQVGVLVSDDPTESPEFYQQVLESRRILEEVLLTEFPKPGAAATDSATLLALWSPKADTRADSIDRSLKLLHKRTNVQIDRRTNIVRLSADAHDPSLAAAIANAFMRYLNDFNDRVRNTRGREERNFLDGVSDQEEKQLRASEDSLREFYERNKGWATAPHLVFQEGRLRRQVDLHQQLYLTLRQQAQAAGVQEVNDVPALTVLDRAVPPTKKAKPKRLAWLVLSLFLTFALGIAVALARDAIERAEIAQNPSYLNVRDQLRATLSEISGRFLRGGS